MTKIKKMDIEEFQEVGFLQEVNRLFFHPLGLALEVEVDDNGVYSLGGIWDYRNVPEGIIFGDTSEDRKLERIKKRDFIEEYSKDKFTKRKKILGYIVQPLDDRPTLGQKKRKK